MQLRDIPYMFGYTKIVKVDDKLLRGNAIFMPTKIARLKELLLEFYKSLQ